MNTGEGFSLLAVMFGLDHKQQRLALQIGWVVIVSIHMAWAWGAFALIGLAGPARSDDMRQMQDTVRASARVTLSQEIRAQVRIRCGVSDPEVNAALTRYIDSIQNEYERVAGARLIEPPCPNTGRPS